MAIVLDETVDFDIVECTTDILSGESSETDTIKEEDHSIYENVSKK